MNTPIIRELNAGDEVFSGKIYSNVTLKNHQLASLYQCIQLENADIDTSGSFAKFKTNIGLLSDSVGSGKSYVMLALLAVNESPTNMFNKVNVYGAYNSLCVEFNPTVVKKLDLNVLVCSFGLIEQWIKYIRTFYKETVKYCVVNSKKSVIEFQKNYNEPKLVLVSSTFYHTVQSILRSKNHSVKRVIFDEADNSATPNAKQIPADFYWFISATYKNVINPYPKYSHMFQHSTSNNNVDLISAGVHNNVFIKNLFGTLARTIPYNVQSVLGKIIIKNNDEFIKKSFSLPSVVSRYIECIDMISELVNSMTNNDHIINSVNAGDLETAISFLNKNNKGDEKHIINILKEDLEKNVMNCRATIEYHKQLIVDDEEQKEIKLKQLAHTEKSLLHKIEMITNRIKEGDICSICFCNQENKTVTKCCKNAFCFECICKWLKVQHMCPLCKTNIASIENDLLVIENPSDVVEVDERLKPLKKLETFKMLINQIIKKNNNSKILIFSEYDKAFENISPLLKEMKIKYGVLKGNSLKSNLELYKNNNMDVLLINSKAYGSGLNLENTTDIIIYHFFNKELEQQVIGRAQRPGRNTPLNVWYLFNKSEFAKYGSNNINRTTIDR
jgi:superfamily II DNA or RNA helicase